jgi:hypothetical protein
MKINENITKEEYITLLESALYDLIGGFDACDIEAHYGKVQKLTADRCDDIYDLLQFVYLMMEKDENENKEENK